MATPEYTDQQKKAVHPAGESLALDAGAGCGKTFVLTERFIKELEKPSDAGAQQRLTQLVAITFTDAAARELRTRIRRLVYDRIATSSGENRDYWLQLQRAIDGCRISTIHSLCTTILRAHAFDARLDPLFTTLDSPAAMVLEAEAVEDTLRELLESKDADAMRLGGAWNIDQLKTHVRSMMQHHRRQAFRDWCDKTPDDLLAAWLEYFKQVIWPAAVAGLQPELNDLIDLLGQFSSSESEAMADCHELIDALVALRDNEAEEHHFLSIDELCRNRKYKRPVPFLKKAWGDDVLHAEFGMLSKTVREAVRELPVFHLGNDFTREFAELGLAMARVSRKAAERYQAAKQELGGLDFEDLITATHQLLTDPKHRDIQEHLRSEVAVLFVDEFQDTDRVQVEMVQALVGDIAGAGKLFFVGDEKQSIYRFRGAEPQVFRELQGAVKEDWRLPLSKNFRSQPAVLNFVNALFEPLFSNYQALEASRSQLTPEPAIEFLWADTPKASKSGGKQAGETALARRAEARTIAARLREMVDKQQPLATSKGATEPRPVEYGDIAILFRALSDVAAYEEALRAEGIPYYLVGGHAFYTQQEIYDVLHLLRVVVSECDELSLAGVLRSPLFSLADETIFWLSVRGRSLERGLFAESLPPELMPEERDKVIRAADTLRVLRKHRDDWTVPQLLAEAMERTGYDAALLADFMGQRKLANVYKLMEQARSAVASGVGSLDDFVTQLAEFITATPKESLATTSPDTANVVRLMTIHKSKGLEFPVVVVADLDHKASFHRSAVAFTPELGPMVTLSKNDYDDASSKNSPPSGMSLFRYVDNQAERAETDRLFYVACTRAADYLLLSSSVADIDKPSGPFLKQLSQQFDLKTGDMLQPGRVESGARPQVAASLVTPPAPKQSTGKSTNWLKVIEKAKQGARSAKIEQAARPCLVAAGARQRFSVTRLSGQIIPSGGDWWQHDPDHERLAVPLDYDPLGLGTLVHAVLERADLADEQSIATWARALAPHYDLLHAERAEELARELVERFAESPRAASLATAQQVYHEVEFQLTWPIGSTNSQGRYLQGYLDCLYQTSDGDWCVLDYKTNQTMADDTAVLADKYEMQMLVYGLAVEQTWGEGPKELVLHFLRPGVEQCFAWDDQQRERAIALVDQALASIDSAEPIPVS
ncbi:UvrD-helicase domain-containing protein [Aeoliella mucimassa]|uniref:DNA 3'-5' helicase n=1 Tax=Aeoliella mucimassa TaxID=2527972 RepID=A0A518ATI4_9BACT|nr:UvrD-helicase domain-containing protein [Aeoliella mucimassa]QDU58040.1 ATP-dependent helicase/nuclease subunit A [Aeoliella mucimassa]